MPTTIESNTTTNVVLGKAYIHSTYVKNGPGGRDGIVISELQYNSDGTITPHLNVVKEPKRKIYVTKPEYRNHTEKKEREHISKLDIAEISNVDLNKELFKRINGYYPRGYVDNSILNNPYIYGASASIEFLTKLKYDNAFKKTGLVMSGYTKGFLDIETSVEEDTLGELISIAYTHENKVYTTVVSKYFVQETLTGHYKGCDITILEKTAIKQLTELMNVLSKTNEYLTKHPEKAKFEFYFYVGKDDVDCIRWIFDNIHQNKTTFIGVWNMGFDMPIILDCLKKKKIDPTTIMCPKELPDGYKSVWYQHDKKKVAHIVDKWDWCHITGYTQFYDAMSLYAKLRTDKGKQSSYALDGILVQNEITSKLTYAIDGHSNIIPGHTDWHRYMVKHNIYQYLIYMMWDAMSITCMEWQNQDVDSFLILADVTPIAKSLKQTIKLHDVFYKEWQPQGWILATCRTGMDDSENITEDIKGGAVLNPYLIMDNIGMKIYKYAPLLHTNVYPHVNDADFSSMYPTVMRAFNTCKETKLSTMTSIKIPLAHQIGNYAVVELFHSYLANPEISAINMASTFFSLPGYEDMEHLFKEQLNNHKLVA